MKDKLQITSLKQMTASEHSEFFTGESQRTNFLSLATLEFTFNYRLSTDEARGKAAAILMKLVRGAICMPDADIKYFAPEKHIITDKLFIKIDGLDVLSRKMLKIKLGEIKELFNDIFKSPFVAVVPDDSFAKRFSKNGANKVVGLAMNV